MVSRFSWRRVTRPVAGTTFTLVASLIFVWGGTSPVGARTIDLSLWPGCLGSWAQVHGLRHGGAPCSGPRSKVGLRRRHRKSIHRCTQIRVCRCKGRSRPPSCSRGHRGTNAASKWRGWSCRLRMHGSAQDTVPVLAVLGRHDSNKAST